MAVSVPSDVSCLENGGGNLYRYVGQHKYLAREEIDGLSKSYVHSLGKNHVTASEQLMLLMS